MTPTLSTLQTRHFDQAAKLIHLSLVHWYETHLQQGHRFGSNPENFRIFPELYAALDPEESIAAFDPSTSELLGVCFCHPRPTHHAIGIVATHPAHSGKGIASTMVREALRRAQAANLPTHLVSSLFNLDSFSLYTRHGFSPHAIYQDIHFDPARLQLPASSSIPQGRIRRATATDASLMAEMECYHRGISREKDFHFLLSTNIGHWQASIHTRTDGTPDGFMFCGGHPDSPMIGPGFAPSTPVALALIHHTLTSFPHTPLVMLAPADQSDLITTLYQWGGRNIELHAAQSTHRQTKQEGLCFPTFLPESF